MNLFLRFILILSFLFIFACKNNNEEKISILKEKDLDLQMIDAYNEGLKFLDEGDGLSAAKKFTEAELLYPQSLWAPRSSLMSAYSYYKQSYYINAIEELKRFIKIMNNVSLEDGSKNISIDKSNVSLDIDFEIKYSNSLIGNQRNKINVYEDNLFDIYNSRTFCLYEDVEKLKRMNLAKGGSLNNAIVVNNEKILNEEGLRNNKEFVNHKILDCIGDLFLIGYKLIGNVKCTQGGHKLTNEILRKVFSNKENYSIIDVKGKNIPFSIKSYKSLKYIA